MILSIIVFLTDKTPFGKCRTVDCVVAYSRP